MRRNAQVMVAGVCSALALLAARRSPAHHSYALFDGSRHVQVSGTVRNLEWGNPHVWLWLVVTDQTGQIVIYAFEGKSIGEMARKSGWTKGTVRYGDRVTVKYTPFRDGKNGGHMDQVIFADGHTLTCG